MVYVKILCDDKFDNDLSYQIEGEIIGKYNPDACDKCNNYEECQGWKRVFNRCGVNNE